MDFASLMRAYPGRFLPGIGHGRPGWLPQVGQLPSSLMACLSEVTEVTQRLLEGETVTFHGRHVKVDEVAILHPPGVVTVPSLAGPWPARDRDLRAPRPRHHPGAGFEPRPRTRGPRGTWSRSADHGLRLGAPGPAERRRRAACDDTGRGETATPSVAAVRDAGADSVVLQSLNGLEEEEQLRHFGALFGHVRTP